MDPEYTWARIGKHDATECSTLEWYMWRQTKRHILDIGGALIHDRTTFKASVDRWVEEKTILCITGELKRSVDGDPASNFRYKKNAFLNQNVIENYRYLFTLHQEKTKGMPIFVTTIPRSWRIFSWLINEDGSIIRKDERYKKKAKAALVGMDPVLRRKALKEGKWGEADHDYVDTELMGFLNNYGVTPQRLIKIRESCKGARYNTYLIDMISFLYQMKIGCPAEHDTFGPDYRVISTEGSKLSFEDTVGNDGTVFFVPGKDDVGQLYRDMDLAISSEENAVKASIRKHLIDHRIDRWTDFDANDTDDAFLFLMLIHAFKGQIGSEDSVPYDTVAMTSDEGEILGSLEGIMEMWFYRMNEL